MMVQPYEEIGRPHIAFVFPFIHSILLCFVLIKKKKESYFVVNNVFLLLFDRVFGVFTIWVVRYFVRYIVISLVNIRIFRRL